MGRNFGRIIIMLGCTILLAAAAQAKTLKEVYLKAGGIIECQKVWQSGGKVMVLVNRDTLVDLPRDEVNLKKTFGKKPSKAVKRAKVRKKKAHEAIAATPQAPPEMAAKPAEVSTTAQKAANVPAAKPIAPSVKPPQAAVKPVAPTAKPAQPAVKPAPPAAKTPQTAVKPAAPIAKPPVQGIATAARKAAPDAAATGSQAQRPNLSLAKSAPPPPPEKSFLESNLLNIALVALLVLLVAGYLVYKKK